MHPAVMITTILAGAFTLAMVAVVFSKQAQTGTVLTQAGTALSSVIQAAVSPVSGTAIGNSLGNTLGNPLIPSPAG